MINRHKFFCLFFGVSLLGACAATLFPLNFVIPRQISWQSIIEQFHHGTNIKDYVRNVLLFVPLGIGLGGIMTVKKYQPGQIVALSLIFSLIVTSNLELLQILLPSRVSSLSDIVCNSLGGLLGASLYVWSDEIIVLLQVSFTGNYHKLNPMLLTVIIISYCCTLSLGSWLLLSNANLSNWQDDYYLAIGNEIDRDITWSGYITSLYICDRGLNQQEAISALSQAHTFFTPLPSLVAAYVFSTNQKSYQDQTQQQPDLVWKTRSSVNHQIEHPAGIPINYFHNLISQASPTILNQKIRQSNQFSLSLTIASQKLKQVGPARIITLGKDLEHRNLMIGQEENNLTFSLRTPITGEKAEQPEFIIPNLFTDRQLHQILITFAEKKITFYIDQIDNQYTFEFHPASISQLYLPWHIWRWQIDLSKLNLAEKKLIFLGWSLLPLVTLLRILLAHLQYKKISNQP